MIRLPILTAAAVTLLLLSGCGEDSATEPRLNFITMINAKDVNITGRLFTKTLPIAPKDSVDDSFEAVSEAPDVWYDDHVGVETISQGTLINAYIAVGCMNGSGIEPLRIYHTPSPGSVNIVNATSNGFSVDINGNIEAFGACSVREFDGASLSDQDSITVNVYGSSFTINLPKNGEVFDVVVFPDFTVQQYAVKAFKG